jgi:hypothetical protein
MNKDAFFCLFLFKVFNLNFIEALNLGIGELRLCDSSLVDIDV